MYWFKHKKTHHDLFNDCRPFNFALVDGQLFKVFDNLGSLKDDFKLTIYWNVGNQKYQFITTRA